MADTGAHNVTQEQSTDGIDLSDRKNEAGDCKISLVGPISVNSKVYRH